ncbi:hypothetical protein JET14_21805 (plasmid) [Martelella lutilitoris]|uniref:Uncharacterized protein n=1 Tax=Martelella lutilitoris TaxID=2583532 RepID=A0A7T7KNS2_9HYPH|nr:hypothetical protein [Martelella lutilitoris]QQM33095.1 hypothetical protein JET14_21805 [Martelella lutilitoris]QRX65245.1 hypothetical protein JS578_14485 [Dysgonomonadaceae bacterium zrk40]
MLEEVAGAERQIFNAHAFGHARAAGDIRRRTTKAGRPRINGQVERHAVKAATVKRFCHVNREETGQPLAGLATARSFSRRPKILEILTRHGFDCGARPSRPHRFDVTLLHVMARLKKAAVSRSQVQDEAQAAHSGPGR